MRISGTHTTPVANDAAGPAARGGRGLMSLCLPETRLISFLNTPQAVVPVAQCGDHWSAHNCAHCHSSPKKGSYLYSLLAFPELFDSQSIRYIFRRILLKPFYLKSIYSTLTASIS
ncbi:hypothetical protein CEXT_267581 [Caerostris extrusa]|uniref:Uncharacterized protein n=1 Tax=Caerostris extrusa TaxID=172846 RepID=A0AAV4UL39_CAEEX|nr:hypothetical protein CEXT_267581 [Caerostris extrusa]